VPRLIGCFCHKEPLSPILFGSQANHQSKLLQRQHLREAMGEGGRSGGQELRYPTRIFTLCTTGLGCGRTRFGSRAVVSSLEFLVPSSQFSVEGRFVWTEN
jgi:hypothetical protein